MSTDESAVAAVREGCRWIHNPPPGDEFGSWFEQNVPIHAGLNAVDYVNGIALIPNKEKLRRTRLDSNGNRVIAEEERLVFSPYPQVETRIRYFWDFCRENGYVGEISHILPREQSKNLPPGVIASHMPASPTTNVIFLCASYQVRVFEPNMRTGGKGRVVMEPPLGSKHVPLIAYGKPDVNAAMRAQTGAIGRALGFAGMLIVPGTGVSSAEDMLDLAAPTTVIESAVSTPEIAPVALADFDAGAPEVVAGPKTSAEQGTLEEIVAGLMDELAGHPEAFEQFKGWATERGHDLENPPPALLRPLEKQLRRKLEDARCEPAPIADA